jgi:hypothetical protein
MAIPGPPGPQGPVGQPGPTGAQGPDGNPGANGANSYSTPIPFQRSVGNDTPGADSLPTPTSIHQQLDWTAGYTDWRWTALGQAIQLGNVLNFDRTDPFTLAAWVDADSFTHLGAVHALIFRRGRTSDNRGFAWGTGPTTGVMRIHIGVGGSANSLVIDTTTSLVLGKRTLVVMTYSGLSTPASVQHYFDAVAQPKTTITNGLAASIAGPGPLSISYPLGAWRGGIRHASIWDVALTQLQVTELFNNGVPGDLLTHSAAANLRGWWKIEGPPDRTIVDGVADSSGNGLTGTRVNGLGGKRWLAPLSTRSNCMTMGNVLGKDRLDAFTYSCWATIPAGVGGHLLIKYDGVLNRGQRMLFTGNQFYFRHENQDSGPGFNRISVRTTASGTGIVDGLPHHYVATYSGSSTAAGVQLYIDGVLQAKTTEASGDTLTLTTLNTSDLYIAGWTQAGSVEPKHASVWGKALSGAEVAELYNFGVPPDCTTLSMAADLEGWWVIDEDDDHTVSGGILDRSGNGLHATALPEFAPQSTIVPHSMLVRDQSRWRFLFPGTTNDRPLTSTGLGKVPAYSAALIASSQFNPIPAYSLVANPIASPRAPHIIEVPENSVVGRLTGENLEAKPAVNGHFAAAAAIALSKLETIPAFSVVVNSDPVNPAVPTTIAMPTDSVLGVVGGTMVAAPVVADQISNATLIYQKLAAQAAAVPYGGGGVFRIHLAFAVGGAVDTTLITFGAGIGARILDVILRVTTAVGGSTLILRSATGGLGTALSTSFSAAATGYFRNDDTQTRTCAAATPIVMRRSSTGIAGSITILLCRN